MEQLSNYKVVLVGRSNVGKSSLLLRFTDDLFQTNYQPTIGVDFRFRKLQIGEERVRLQVWDTAGQEKYFTITKTFYKNTHCVVIVFDLTDKKTFSDVENIWIQEIKKNCDENVELMLIGNKSDAPEREVQEQEARAYAEKNKMIYYETSAKEGTNVEKAFVELATKVHHKVKSDHQKQEQEYSLASSKPRENFCCKN